MTGSGIEEAIQTMRERGFVMVYDADGREEECDFFLAAEFCEPSHIRTMRKDGGGLVFLMVRPDIRDRLGLPFLQDLYPLLNRRFPVLDSLVPDDIPYDTKSSFSISINHRRTFTGITDIDRALTVKEFALLGSSSLTMDCNEAISLFGDSFRTPGHVPLCLGSDRILENRFGHTELSCALSTMAGLSGVTVGCEVMGDDGRAKPKAEVMEYALERGIPFLEGKQIIEAWREWQGDWKKNYRPPPRDDRSCSKEPDEGPLAFPHRGTRVMATGVFDLLHPGHLSFFNQARLLGDELVVVVARDSTVRKLKRRPVNSERVRRDMVEALGVVDGALLGYEGDPYRIVRELDPDIFVLGYDQEPAGDELEKEFRKRGIRSKVVRLQKRQGDIDCTTKIIARIREGDH